MNPITGEKAISINGEKYTLRYTWKALSEIEAKHGDNPNLFSPDVVADVAAAGLRNKHPEMTAERIKELSPPLVPFAKSIQQALQWAYFGNESIATNADGVKKNPLTGGLWMRTKSLLRRG
jgi:hypothetical protein